MGHRKIVLLVAIAAGFTGCHLGGSCLAGQSSACSCSSGATGAQVCGSDETFGECQCGLADAGSPQDAGPPPQCATPCSTIASSSCNAVTQQGNCVATTVLADDGQAFVGGVISPGTYVLDTMTFALTPPTDFTFAMTLEVTQTSTNTYDFELMQSNQSCPEERFSYSFVTQGGNYTMSCPTTDCGNPAGCNVSSQYLVESPCRFTLHGAFGYLQEFHFMKLGTCQP